MTGGTRQKCAHTSAYDNQHEDDTCRQTALTDHYPDTITRTPEGIRNKRAAKTRLNTATPLKAAASSSHSKRTAQQMQHSQKGSNVPNVCHITTVEQYCSTNAAKVSSPEDSPSKARDTCRLVRKKREGGQWRWAYRAL